MKDLIFRRFNNVKYLDSSPLYITTNKEERIKKRVNRERNIERRGRSYSK